MMISNFVIMYETITLHHSLNHSIKNKTKIEEKKEQRGENTFMFREIDVFKELIENKKNDCDESYVRFTCQTSYCPGICIVTRHPSFHRPLQLHSSHIAHCATEMRKNNWPLDISNIFDRTSLKRTRFERNVVLFFLECYE